MSDEAKNILTVAELEASYPELVRQIRDTAAADAAKAENERLKGIDDIAPQIAPDMVADAKYGENKVSAETLAINAFKRNAVLANNAFANLKNDVSDSGTEAVGASANAGIAEEPGLDSSAKVNNLAGILKKKRGE